VQTFVMDEPIIYLEKLKDGKANWEDMIKDHKKAEKAASERKTSHAQDSHAQDSQAQDSQNQNKHKKGQEHEQASFPIQTLLVDTFSITKGKLQYIDRAQGTKKDNENEPLELADLNLNLDNISFEKPILLSLDAKLGAQFNKQPISLKGYLGPISKNPGQEDIDIDLILEAAKQLEMKIKGRLTAPMKAPGFDLNISVSPFSPIKLASTLNQPLPFTPGDASVLQKLGLSFTAKGDAKKISLTSGKMLLDDSTLDFSAQAKKFHLPDLKLELKLDSIDLDRYLPISDPDKTVEKKETNAATPSAESKAAAPSKKTQQAAKTKQTSDYTALKKLILDGNIKIGKIKAKALTLENIDAHILAKNGVIKITPLKLDLYEGILSTHARMDVRDKEPAFRLHMDMKGVQVFPLIKDALKKEIIKGQLNTLVDLSMIGDTPDMIKNTLTGEGKLLLADGTIIGIDLADTVRSIQIALGLSNSLKEKPKTDFAEIKIPFLANKGLINIGGTSLTSPLLRVKAEGTVHLPKEQLNLKVHPKLVSTIKGQGDSKEYLGLAVPVDITGSFDSPKVAPDLEGILNNALSTDPKKLKDQLIDSLMGKESRQNNNRQNNKRSEPDVEKQIKNIFKAFGQ
jgi:AsmA protein